MKIIVPYTTEHNGVLAQLRAALPADELVVVDKEGQPSAGEDISDAEVFIRWWSRRPLSEGVVANAPRLRWMHTPSAGLDQVLFPALVESDIVLTNSSGVHAIPISEWVMLYILAAAKRLPELLAAQREHRWVRDLPLQELTDQTLLILGYGAIGQDIGKRAAAFGMRVIAARRGQQGKAAPVTDRVQIVYGEEWREHISQADYVAVALPLTAQTRGMIDAATIAAMKPSAWFINIARGEIADEDALLHALQEGRIAGAGLDAFAEEPLPANHPLYRLPESKVILTPHISWSSPHIDRRVLELFRENLRRYKAGQPLLNVVDKRAGYLRFWIGVTLMTPYQQLSSRAQIGRERQLAEATLPRYGLHEAKLTLITHNFNTVYRVDALAGRFMMRIQEPNTLDAQAIRSELAWLTAIRRDTDLLVPEPLNNDAGAMLTNVSAVGMPSERHIAVFRWMDGKMVGKTISPTKLYKVGVLMAKLHQYTQSWQPPTNFTRPRWDWARLFGVDSVFGNGKIDPLLTAETRAIYTAASQYVLEAMTALGTSPVAYGLIHNDLHSWNYLYHKGEIEAIDFEVSGWGVWGLDMAVTIEALRNGANKVAMRDAFLRGYSSVRPLPPGFEMHERAMLVARLATMANWAVESNNPELKAEAPAIVLRLADRMAQTMAGA